MAKKIYALLVGINDYQSPVPKLAGCLNDVNNFHDYLTGSFNKSDLEIKVLKDSDATRENIIKQFRDHLRQAQAGDVAVFQFCGHGARWKSAAAFKEIYPDGKDEGLVCYDSRRPGGFDLADKELAVLLAEVAKNSPHLTVILDCCHSGSGTRGGDAFSGLRPRFAFEVTTERPLDSYVNGHYAELLRKKESLRIPSSKHILLAACERTQLAQEAPDNSGVFTSTLVEVLDMQKGAISYADLFRRCRATVRKRADNQNPQFEAYYNFNPYAGFLGYEASDKSRPYRVFFEGNSWKVDAGAIHGLPTDLEKSAGPEKSVGLVLYRADGTLAGNASTTVVGPHESEVELAFEHSDTSVSSYSAEITRLPVAPIPVYFTGDEKSKEVLQKELENDRSVNVAFTDVATGTSYALSAVDGKFLLKQQEMDFLIQGVEVNPDKREIAAKLMLAILKQVAQWERSLTLQNHGTQMDPAKVDFVFVEKLDNGQEHEYPAGEITLDYVKSKGEWKKIEGKFKVRNRTSQLLHVMFAHFSNAYGIEIYSNEPLSPGQEKTLEVGGNPEIAFWVEDPANYAIENLKLIVSTEKVDDFLLSLEDLELGKIVSPTRGFGAADQAIKKYEKEWFTKSFRIKIVRQQDQVSAQNAKLAQGKIVVKGHPAVKANLSLSAAKTPTRGSSEGSDFYKAFERQGLTLLNFSNTRGDNESILELTDIANDEALQQNPLEIEINEPLKDNEGILPFVFDGQHVWLGGDPSKDENGITHVSIDHIPEIPDNRRGVGKSLKLYFFKTYLKQSVNQLRWVEYKTDGSFEYHKNMLADKVAAAQNVLLLVHGIIGDTETMVKGVKAAGLDQKFDLVLAYDYENLKTPIEATAEELKTQLAAAGLQENDNKKLTLLVHSMGGLVSRCFIEQKGGNKVVDHLVMCGTPNNGSPFGKIEAARKILKVLTGLAVNYFPPLIPFSGAVLLLLKRSEKITSTLEQMNPDSDFIKALNSSEDPGIRYTILAGDVDEYKEPSDQFSAKMLAKAGQSFIFEALFGMKANDIAVSVESVLGVTSARTIAPVRKNVACHHLNYFISEAGQQALQAVAW